MIEILVCDWSGVISDDAPPVYEANMRLLEEHGKARITFEEWKRVSASSPSGFLENCGINADPEETDKKYKKYFSEICAQGERPDIIPGVLETLEKLRAREARLAVLSSHPHKNLMHEMGRYGITGFFEFALGGVADKALELSEFCGVLGFDRRKTLYAGDTIYDVRAARQAGVLSAAICNGYHSRERLEAENPDFVFENFSWVVGVV